MRVWIEMNYEDVEPLYNEVTLHVRVWIEILLITNVEKELLSHPPREGVD